MNELLVLREDHDGLCYLTLNRPHKLNALNRSLFEQLRAHVLNLKTDVSVRCVIIRGAGKCFSAGHDLESLGASEELTSPFWHSETLRLMEKLPQPVIAAVHGHCYTGALEVALAADFILASDSARFGDTHAKWALAPVWGMSQRLPRRVGIATAKRLMFSCAMISAEEALRIGLCELVFPDTQFEQTVEQTCRQIADNSPFSHAANKRLLQATDGQSIDAGLVWEVMESEGVGPDAQERIAIFNKS